LLQITIYEVEIGKYFLLAQICSEPKKTRNDHLKFSIYSKETLLPKILQPSIAFQAQKLSLVSIQGNLTGV